MNKPKWQKAKVIKNPDFIADGYDFVGKELWVAVGEPEVFNVCARYPDGTLDRSTTQILGLEVGGLIPSCNVPSVLIPVELIELQSRSESDFRFDDPPPIPFDVWSQPDWKGM